jgi:hypothetical protein
MKDLIVDYSVARTIYTLYFEIPNSVSNSELKSLINNRCNSTKFTGSTNVHEIINQKISNSDCELYEIGIKSSSNLEKIINESVQIVGGRARRG